MVVATGIQPNDNKTWTTFARLSINNSDPPTITFGMICFVAALVQSTDWLQFVYDETIFGLSNSYRRHPSKITTFYFQKIGADEHEVYLKHQWKSTATSSAPIKPYTKAITGWTNSNRSSLTTWSSGECFLGSFAVFEGEIEEKGEQTTSFSVERSKSVCFFVLKLFVFLVL
jgi:hypothetical protein